MPDRPRPAWNRGPQVYALVSADDRRYLTRAGTFAPLPTATGGDCGDQRVLPADAMLGRYRQMDVVRRSNRYVEPGAMLHSVDLGEE